MDKFVKTPTPIEMVKKINEVIDSSHALQRNTAYAVGDIAYSPLLPSWARLECVKAGTSADVQPEWTNVFGGGVLPDGGLVWLLEDVRDGLMVGGICLDYVLRSGRVKGNGALLQRASYPRLFKWVQDNAAVQTTEANWTNAKHLYTLGDGSTTFRIPDLRSKWLQMSDGVGQLAAGLPNVLGHYSGNIGEAGGVSGALYIQNQRGHAAWNGSYAVSRLNDLVVDASRCNSIYKNDFGTVQPPSIQLIAQIKY